jgi:ACS family tartrate transporter-like MFS transporter
MSTAEPLPGELLGAGSFATETLPGDAASLGRAAVRRISRRLLPLLGLGYGVAYIDRLNVSFAALQMNRQLHFSASIYGMGAGLFFLGYAVFEVPSNLLLLRFGARRWLARILFTWGLLAAGMLLVRTPREFYVMRSLLGMAEAGFFPGVIYYLSQWFPPEERARAVSGFYVAYPIGAAVMGGVAGAILRLDGRLGMAGWQWLFLLEGLPALVLGFVFLGQLPDGPADARWLPSPERAWLLDRLATERVAITRSTGGVRDGGWPALLREVRFWQMSVFFLFMLTAGYAYSLSAPAILAHLTGFSPGQVGYLVAGMSLVGAAAMIANARHSDRTGERYLHTAVPFLLMSVGYIAAGLSTAPWVAVPGLALSLIAYTATMGPQWAIPPTFLEGPAAARGIAAMNTVGMVGGFVGPYWMGVIRDHTGSYDRGLLCLAVLTAIAAGIMLEMRRAAARGSALATENQVGA